MEPHQHSSIASRIIKAVIVGGLILAVICIALLVVGFSKVGNSCQVHSQEAAKSMDANLSRIALAGYSKSPVSATITGNCVDTAMSVTGSIKFTGGSKTVEQLVKDLEAQLQPKNNLVQTSSIDELISSNPSQPQTRTADKNNFRSISLNSLSDGSTGNYLIDFKLDKIMNCPALTGTMCDKNNRTAIDTYKLSAQTVTSITISQGLDIH